MELFSSILEFEDAYGDLITVRKPPILIVEEFRNRYMDLLEYMKKDHMKDYTLEEAYGKNQKFRRKVDNLLELVKIDAKKLDADILTRLLLPYTGIDEEGNEVYIPSSALCQFIFGEVKKGPVKGHSNDEIAGIAGLIGQMWAITEDFNETMTILNTFNYEDLDKILAARNWTMKSPEDRAKINQHKASQKLLNNLKAGKVKSERKVETAPLSDSEMDKFFA